MITLWCRTWLCSHVGAQGEWSGLWVGVEEHGGAGHTPNGKVPRIELVDEVAQRSFLSAAVGGHDVPSLVPGHQDCEDRESDRQRDPAAVRDLRQIGGEERDLDGEEHRGAERDQRPGFAPKQPGDREKQNRVQNERAGDRDAVGGGECDRGAEGDDDRDHRHEQGRVDRRRVDLPDWRSEVWRIVSRGRTPSCTACRVTLNAPEITDC
jgi:hypothetical protein